MKKVIRLTERDLMRLVKRVIKEQNDDAYSTMIDYINKSWENKTEIEQNSAFIEVINTKTNSRVVFNFQKSKIYYNKNFAIDPNPIPLNSTFQQFKTWFDKHNNYNPLSGIM